MTARVRAATARARRSWHAAAIASLLVLQAALATDAAAQMPGMTDGAMSMMEDRKRRTFLLAELLEITPTAADREGRIEGLAWIGGDYNRLWLKVEGERPTARGPGSQGDLQADAYYGRLVSPFWTALAGGRLDTRSWGGQRATRGMLAVGFEGLAPFLFEFAPTLFVSQKGDVSAQLTTSFDLLFTQRLILQPRLEVNAAVQGVPEFGVAPGLNDFELGARARYEFRREFAPYVGVNWLRRTGGTAGLARSAGEAVGDVVFVAGVRLWR